MHSTASEGSEGTAEDSGTGWRRAGVEELGYSTHVKVLGPVMLAAMPWWGSWSASVV